MLGGNFTLGFTLVKVFQQLPAQGKRADFAGGEDFLEQDFHLPGIAGAGKYIDEFPGRAIHELAF